MKVQASTGRVLGTTILSVSPFEQDHMSVQSSDQAEWALYKANTLGSALKLLRQRDIAVVLCERDLAPGTWTGMLEQMNRMPEAPPLIVTSRLADEGLWVEALNLGAYDVLAKPFDRRELVRSISLASLHWRNRHEIPSRFVKVMRAAG